MTLVGSRSSLRVKAQLFLRTGRQPDGECRGVVREELALLCRLLLLTRVELFVENLKVLENDRIVFQPVLRSIQGQLGNESETSVYEGEARQKNGEKDSLRRRYSRETRHFLSFFPASPLTNRTSRRSDSRRSSHG